MATGHRDDLEHVAERRSVGVEQVVVRQVRLLAEHEEGRDADFLERWRARGHLAVGRDHGRLRVAIAPTVGLLHEVVPKLVLDERPRGAMELALLVATIDRLLEAPVPALDACVLGGPEGDGWWDEDCRVEEHEPIDRSRPRSGPLEREPAAERVPQPDPLVSVEGCREVREVVGDPPRGLPLRVAVAEQVGRGHTVRRSEERRERLEVPAPRRDAVEADDRRSALLAEVSDVEPAHRQTPSAVRGVRSGPRPPYGGASPLESP